MTSFSVDFRKFRGAMGKGWEIKADPNKNLFIATHPTKKIAIHANLTEQPSGAVELNFHEIQMRHEQGIHTGQIYIENETPLKLVTRAEAFPSHLDNNSITSALNHLQKALAKSLFDPKLNR